MAHFSKISAFLMLTGALISSGKLLAETTGTLGTPYAPTVTEILATPVKPAAVPAPAVNQPAAAAVPAQPTQPHDRCVGFKESSPEAYAACVAAPKPPYTAITPSTTTTTAATTQPTTDSPATTDQCAAFKEYPGSYVVCQDRIKKIQAMRDAQDARTKRITVTPPPASGPPPPSGVSPATMAYDPTSASATPSQKK